MEIVMPSRVFLIVAPFLVKVFPDENMNITFFVVCLMINCLKRQFSGTTIALQGAFTYIKQHAQILIIKQNFSI